MINYFTIPDSYKNFELNLKLINIWKEHPEFFNENVKIASVYGCPPPCIWNGNRLNQGAYSCEEVEITLSTYKNNDINYNFTFTNSLIEEKHLSDTFGNYLAFIGESEGNKVIVNNDIMENYIRQNYPKYKIIKSIVNFFNDPSKINIDLINELSEKDVVVLPLKWNNDFETLKKLTHPENIEVLTNQPCEENCPFSKDHYMAYNRSNLHMPVEPWEVSCRYKNDNPRDYRNRKFYVSYDMLSKYNELGINHFKIAGRDIPDLALDEYIVMFVKDEYKSIIYNYLLNITNKDLNWNLITNSLYEKSMRVHPRIHIPLRSNQ